MTQEFDLEVPRLGAEESTSKGLECASGPQIPATDAGIRVRASEAKVVSPVSICPAPGLRMGAFTARGWEQECRDDNV